MLKKYSQKIILFLVSYKKYFIAFIFVLLIIISINVFYSHSDNIIENEYNEYFEFSNKSLRIHIPKKIFFANEKVPITDLYFRKALEKELISISNNPAQLILLNKRAMFWFPLIESVLKQNNIPDDFKYIALIESQLTNVSSDQGAAGFWQLVQSTAKQYRLEISDDVDERYNVEKATRVACLYFKQAYKNFYNWSLVAASYNIGITGLQTQLEKQKVKSYYDLKLTEETAEYIYKILAMKEIITRPKVYGLLLSSIKTNLILQTKKIFIDSSITNLNEFSVKQKINFSELKLFNPWLLTNKLTNEANKKYTIEIPNVNYSQKVISEIFVARTDSSSKDNVQKN